MVQKGHGAPVHGPSRWGKIAIDRMPIAPRNAGNISFISKTKIQTKRKKALFSAYSADFYPAGNTCKERRLRECLENDVIYHIAGE